MIDKLLEKFFALEENHERVLERVNSVLIVRQHNQFGDLLASSCIFRAIKEKYPRCTITLVASPDNYYAITKNKFVDRYFVFNKRKFYSPLYWFKLIRLLRRNYDLAIVPSTVSISLTSLLISRFSNSHTRIGVKSLNGEPNRYDFLFDRRIELDWRKYPDSHVADFGLELLRPFGISTQNFRANIEFDSVDLTLAQRFLESLKPDKDDKIIGIHVGAGKPFNRWSLFKFLKLIENVNELYKTKIYLTGSSSDKKELDFMRDNLERDIGFFVNKKIPELAALISKSDLFITNDTGVMHVAGATDTPQISIFGPTNPFNWAPVGNGKYFIRKSDLIDDVTVNDVFEIVKMIFKGNA